MRRTIMPLAACLCVMLSVMGCVHNAKGLSFSAISVSQTPAGQCRIYFFRDKAFYFVQAPYIVSANIVIDGQPIGGIQNGGFTLRDIAAGKHSFTVWSGTDRTDWSIVLPSGRNVYFQIWDKTRMEGARAAGGFAVGATKGGVTGALQGGHTAAVSGAITEGIQEAVIAFRGRVREGEGRIWAVDLVGEGDAIPLLEQLVESN